MNAANLIGYAAALLVLATFCMRDMVALRATAIASNLAFIAYGVTAGLDPVLMLHVLLLPLNALRLAQARQLSFRPDAAGAAAPPEPPVVHEPGEPS